MTRIWPIVLGTVRDLAPVVAVILFFQVFVAQQPVLRLFPLLEGTLLVLTGLILLLYGLELALFPLGEALAFALAQRGSFVWLVIFAFLLGFGTTFAEPALTAVAAEAAAAAAAGGVIADDVAAKGEYSLGLRLTVALGVGMALVLGVTRIVMGWSLPMVVIGGYVTVTLLAFLAYVRTLQIQVRSLLTVLSKYRATAGSATRTSPSAGGTSHSRAQRATRAAGSSGSASRIASTRRASIAIGGRSGSSK